MTGGLVLGGDGDDTLDAADGAPDRLACGAGVDTILADPIDSLSLCEQPG